MKQNITLSLDRELLRELRLLAAKRSTSVSRMLSEELHQMVARSQKFERSRNHALTVLATGFHLGGQPAQREDLHER
jgi:predicted transcriptional regulator